MQINLDETMMKSLVSEALMKSLDEEKRNALIQAAIEHLLTPQKDYSGRPQPSPIESAFRYALTDCAKRIAEDHLASDAAIAEKIRGLITDALVKITETNREETVRGIAATLIAGLTPKERY